MEALLLMLNSIAIVLVTYMGLRDDRRKPGTPQTSLFRTRDETNPADDGVSMSRLPKGGRRTRFERTRNT